MADILTLKNNETILPLGKCFTEGKPDVETTAASHHVHDHGLVFFH